MSETVNRIKTGYEEGFGNDSLADSHFDSGGINSSSELGSETESEMDPFNRDDTMYINDPVHGMLEIHPLCKAIIDTPEFQRLRYIKQCGLSCFVYPGAVHTRFEHSLGVYYLASRVINKLCQKNMEPISDEESLCVQIAALCHDLGHGPFSHSWELFVRTVVNEDEDRFQHEVMSTHILDYIIENNNSVKEKCNYYGINEQSYRQLIKDLIVGKPKEHSQGSYLFEIVANKQNGLDVDKYEYLLRDSYFFGLKLNIDFERYLTGIKILTDDKGLKHIGYRDKLKWHILDVFKSRAEMHNVAYQHRVCLCLETMLVDLLRLADDHMRINIEGENSQSYKLSECHQDVKAMLKLTDHIFEKILFSNDESLLKAKNLILRILNRDLYAEVLVLILDNEEDRNGVSEESLEGRKIYLNEESLKVIEEELSKKYEAQFRCRMKKLALGQSSEGSICDPLKNIWFVNKDGKRYQIESAKRDPSLWLPKKTRCTKLYVFCDKKGVKGEQLENMKAYAEMLINSELIACSKG